MPITESTTDRSEAKRGGLERLGQTVIRSMVSFGDANIVVHYCINSTLVTLSPLSLFVVNDSIVLELDPGTAKQRRGVHLHMHETSPAVARRPVG